MLDLANEHRLRTSVTLRQLFELQDVAVCEGDMRWQQSEFRQTDVQGHRRSPHSNEGPAKAGEAELTPAQEASRSRLVSGLPTLSPGAFRNAMALTRQAGKAGITFDEAARLNDERANQRTPIRVGRRARQAENGSDDG